MMPSGRIDGGRAVYVSFFNIITYFFYIVKPTGPHIMGKDHAYEGSLELDKNLHMGEPIGNTGPYSRARAVSYY